MVVILTETAMKWIFDDYLKNRKRKINEVAQDFAAPDVKDSHYFLPVFANDRVLSDGSLALDANREPYLFKSIEDVKNAFEVLNTMGECVGALQIDTIGLEIQAIITNKYISPDTYEHDLQMTQISELQNKQVMPRNIVACFVSHGSELEVTIDVRSLPVLGPTAAYSSNR